MLCPDELIGQKYMLNYNTIRMKSHRIIQSFSELQVRQKIVSIKMANSIAILRMTSPV